MRYILILLMLYGCGDLRKSEEIVGEPGKDGESCTVTQYDDGADISCPDGTIAHIYSGKDGVDGQKGADGENGKNGIDGKDGADGKDGTNGIDGEDGKNTLTPIYVGYFCGRVVLYLGDTYYINNSQLVPLSNTWYNVSTSCKVKLKNKKVYEVKS